MHGIESLLREVVAEMQELGEQPPKPFSERNFSGEFLTRVPGELHRRLAIEAAEAGVSLNRLVSFKLALPISVGRPRTRPGKKKIVEKAGA